MIDISLPGGLSRSLVRIFAFTLVLSLIALSRPVFCAADPGTPGALSDEQKAAVSAALAADPKPSYRQVVGQALDGRLPGSNAALKCEELVPFLCSNADNAPGAVEEIVFAALNENRCAAEQVTCRAIDAGAPQPAVVRASTQAAQGALTADLKAELAAALAEEPKVSYRQMFVRAAARGMRCESVVAFLCAEANFRNSDVEKIVFAALVECGQDPGRVVCQALQAGAPLEPVLRAALKARREIKDFTFDLKEITAAASCGCLYSVDRIERVLAGIFAGGDRPQEWGGGTGGHPDVPPPPTQPTQPTPASPSVP